MKRSVWLACSIIALAILGWWAARMWPPTSVLKDEDLSTDSQAQVQLKTLREILRSKNDNDPRLDSDFNMLSPEAERFFRQEYRRIPLEDRNERGTIVYLLGKNLNSDEDWAFMRSVAGEPPCLSLAHCAGTSKPSVGENEDIGDDVTLAYPSLVALKQAQRVLEMARQAGASGGHIDAMAMKEAERVVKIGEKSKMAPVARLAEALERDFSRQGAKINHNLL